MRLSMESHVLVRYFNLHASFHIFFTSEVRFFYALESMTSLWNYDTYLFTDPDEIYTAYVKSNSKHILFMRIFWFSMYFSR